MLNVLRPASRALLTTPTAVRRDLGLRADTDEAVLVALIGQATSAISRYCARSFAEEEVEELLRLPRPGLCAVTLRRYPVRRLASLGENGLALSLAEIRLDCENGVLVRRQGTFSGELVIRYEAGYSLPDPSGTEASDLPADIERACLDLVRFGWFARRRDPALAGEKLPDVYEASYVTPANALPASILQSLAPWRSYGL